MRMLEDVLLVLGGCVNIKIPEAKQRLRNGEMQTLAPHLGKWSKLPNSFAHTRVSLSGDVKAFVTAQGMSASTAYANSTIEHSNLAQARGTDYGSDDPCRDDYDDPVIVKRGHDHQNGSRSKRSNIDGIAVIPSHFG